MERRHARDEMLYFPWAFKEKKLFNEQSGLEYWEEDEDAA